MEGVGARRSHDDVHALPVRDLVGVVAGFERMQGGNSHHHLLAGIDRDCVLSALDDLGDVL